MIKIIAGEKLHALEFRSGESERGKWELINVSDEKGKMKATVFPVNIPTGGGSDMDFVVKRILEVKIGNRKGADGQWRPQTSVSAEVEFIKSDIFVDIDDDGELPWSEGDLMDDIGLPL